MAWQCSPCPAPSRPCTEAGFSLVEVLAALAIAALTAVTLMQFLSTNTRATQRIETATAARGLARAILAEGRSGAGQAGLLRWTSDTVAAGPGLSLRAVRIDAGGRAVLTLDRIEPAAAGAPP